MKIRTSLCAAHLLFAVSVLCACTQHVCGVNINNNNNDNYNEEFVHHHINKTKIENKVVDQRRFPRSMEEKNQAQENMKGDIRSLSLMNITNKQEPDCASKCTKRILPEEHYKNRSGMFIPSCVFPFSWETGQYYNCLNYTEKNRTWCATRVAAFTRLPLSSMWCDGDYLFGETFETYQQDLPPLPNDVDLNAEAACIIPFVHKNQVYYNCTSVDSIALWCATMLSVSGEALMSKYCDPKDASNTSLPTPPKMRYGEQNYIKNCTFPFWHRGVQYNDCTTSGSIIPWCALNISTTVAGVKKAAKTIYCSLHPEYDPYPNTFSPWEFARETLDLEEVYGCKFPFIYKGVIYSLCTTDYSEIPGRSWCAHGTTNYIYPTKMRWCDDGDPDLHLLPRVHHGILCPNCTELHSTGCKVPYTYNNKTYERCNYGVYEIPWCPMEKKNENITRIMPCNPEFE